MEVEPKSPIDVEARREFCDGLIQLSCFLAAAPEVPLPSLASLWSWVYSKEEYAWIAKSFTGEKGKDSSHLFIRKRFGPIILMLAIAHETAQCKRVVTGKKWVEAYKAPGYYQDVVEWHCDDAILAMDREPTEDIEEVTRADDAPF